MNGAAPVRCGRVNVGMTGERLIAGSNDAQSSDVCCGRAFLTADELHALNSEPGVLPRGDAGRAQQCGCPSNGARIKHRASSDLGKKKRLEISGGRSLPRRHAKPCPSRGRAIGVTRSPLNPTLGRTGAREHERTTSYPANQPSTFSYCALPHGHLRQLLFGASSKEPKPESWEL